MEIPFSTHTSHKIKSEITFAICSTTPDQAVKILNKEHFENVKCYAESIGDTSLQKCLERLKSWEGNPDYPCEISLYYDHAPYSFGFTQCYPDGRTGIVGGLLYHGIPDRSFAVTLQPFHGWQIHT